jgi:hypothetical protein
MNSFMHQLLLAIFFCIIESHNSSVCVIPFNHVFQYYHPNANSSGRWALPVLCFSQHFQQDMACNACTVGPACTCMFLTELPNVLLATRFLCVGSCHSPLTCLCRLLCHQRLRHLSKQIKL